MSVTLARHLTLETISVEVRTGMDGQGKPAYDSPVDIQARFVRQIRFVIAADGSKIETQLTVWVPPDAAVLPTEQDRLEEQGVSYIILESKEVKDRAAQLAHLRLLCRRE